MAEQYKARIAALEAELANRDIEIDGLRQAITKMPEFAKLDGDVCFKIEKPNDREIKATKQVIDKFLAYLRCYQLIKNMILKPFNSIVI